MVFFIGFRWVIALAELRASAEEELSNSSLDKLLYVESGRDSKVSMLSSLPDVFQVLKCAGDLGGGV